MDGDVYKRQVDSIAHRAKDLSHLQEELKEEGEDEDLSYEYVNDDEVSSEKPPSFGSLKKKKQVYLTDIDGGVSSEQ